MFSDSSSLSNQDIETKGFLPEIVNNNTNNINEYEQIINNYAEMFSGCISLTSLDLSSFNTKSV